MASGGDTLCVCVCNSNAMQSINQLAEMTSVGCVLLIVAPLVESAFEPCRPGPFIDDPLDLPVARSQVVSASATTPVVRRFSATGDTTRPSTPSLGEMPLLVLFPVPCVPWCCPLANGEHPRAPQPRKSA